MANFANSFMSCHHGVVGDPPIIIPHVNVSMAQATVQNITFDHGFCHGGQSNFLQDKGLALAFTYHGLRDQRSIVKSHDEIDNDSIQW